MRFLVDECAGPRLAQWLRDQQHDVFSIYDQDRGATDTAVLERAIQENRIIVTLDRDFGDHIFRTGAAHRGVVYLRLQDQRTPNKIDVLSRLLAEHADRLANRFVVVNETTVRFAGES